MHLRFYNFLEIAIINDIIIIVPELKSKFFIYICQAYFNKNTIMKKTLLCLLFLFTNFFYAQFSDIEHCAGDTSFNLNSQKTLLIGNLNPAETIVSYHLSLADATNNVNAIVSQASYISNASTKTIYARIDNNGTVTINYFNLILKPALVSFVTATPIDCVNNKSTITAMTTGGKLPYTYSINGQPFGVVNIFNNLSPGVYTIITRDALNCSTNVVIVIEPITPIILTTVKNDVRCQGSNDGSIIVHVPNGRTPITYTLKNQFGAILVKDTQANIFNNLSAGTYTVEAKDSGACTAMITTTISEPNILTATTDVENQTITINAYGGTGKLMYAISPNLYLFSPNNVFSNLIIGIYNVIIQDENGCYFTTEISINPPAPLINGKNTINLDFTPGQTLGDLIIDGQNIKWYSSQNSLSGKTRRTTETTLPLTTVIVDGVTYYASQTINGVESAQRLAVTAKSNGSLSSPDFVLPNFKFYPNPVHHNLSISNTEVIDEIEIFSLSGKSVLAKKINNLHAEIDLSGVSTGIYFVKVKSEGITKSIKIVKD